MEKRLVGTPAHATAASISKGEDRAEGFIAAPALLEACRKLLEYILNWWWRRMDAGPAGQLDEKVTELFAELLACMTRIPGDIMRWLPAFIKSPSAEVIPLALTKLAW